MSRISNPSDPLNESHVSETATSALNSSGSISISSESSLLVPGKLYSDILALKKCYVDIIKQIDPNNNSKQSVKLDCA